MAAASGGGTPAFCGMGGGGCVMCWMMMPVSDGALKGGVPARGRKFETMFRIFF